MYWFYIVPLDEDKKETDAKTTPKHLAFLNRVLKYRIVWTKLEKVH